MGGVGKAVIKKIERSVLAGGVQGPALRPLVGSRGKAPAGVKGAEPPEAPGFCCQQTVLLLTNYEGKTVNSVIC